MTRFSTRIHRRRARDRCARCRLLERARGRLDGACGTDGGAGRFDRGHAGTTPLGFPLGSWSTVITAADLQAGGVTGEGEIGENTGTFTMTMSPDGTWTASQVSETPLLRPVFKGTWTANGPDGFTQVTTFPQDYAGDAVDFTWKIEGGSLMLKVVDPPDPILPIITESHPWQPAG